MAWGTLFAVFSFGFGGGALLATIYGNRLIDWLCNELEKSNRTNRALIDCVDYWKSEALGSGDEWKKDSESP